MGTVNQVLLDRCVTEMKAALKEFGSYTFGDKGPHEVMGVDELVGEYRKLAPEDAAATLVALNTHPKKSQFASQLAETLVGEMQEWEELFEGGRVDSIEW